MAIQTTVQLGHPALRAPNAFIEDFESEEIQSIVHDLIDTMHSVGLIGIAAPQISRNFQVFITEPRQTKGRAAEQSDELRVYINPQIVDLSNEMIEMYEGCGSVANATLFGPVLRPKKVVVEAYELTGQKFRLSSDGILARVIQHEFDHLQGVLFTEKISDYTKLLDLEFYRETVRNDPDQIAASKITVKDFLIL